MFRFCESHAPSTIFSDCRAGDLALLTHCLLVYEVQLHGAWMLKHCLLEHEVQMHGV